MPPGTPAGFATILACRAALLAAGARVVAPCPGAHPCPITAPDWCHFAERLPRSRAHMRAKDANVPFEDEKFSYVAVAREGIDIAPIEARIIAPPLVAKPGTRLRLCTPTGIADRVVLMFDGKVRFDGTPEAFAADPDVRTYYLGSEFQL